MYINRSICTNKKKNKYNDSIFSLKSKNLSFFGHCVMWLVSIDSQMRRIFWFLGWLTLANSMCFESASPSVTQIHLLTWSAEIQHTAQIIHFLWSCVYFTNLFLFTLVWWYKNINNSRQMALRSLLCEQLHKLLVVEGLRQYIWTIVLCEWHVEKSNRKNKKSEEEAFEWKQRTLCDNFDPFQSDTKHWWRFILHVGFFFYSKY